MWANTLLFLSDRFQSAHTLHTCLSSLSIALILSLACLSCLPCLYIFSSIVHKHPILKVRCILSISMQEYLLLKVTLSGDAYLTELAMSLSSVMNAVSFSAGPSTLLLFIFFVVLMLIIIKIIQWQSADSNGVRFIISPIAT